MWNLGGVGLFLLVRQVSCYLKTSFKTVHEVSCDQCLLEFKSDAETLILPNCLVDRGHWVTFLRAQNPKMQIYLERSQTDKAENNGASGSLIKVTNSADLKSVCERGSDMRLILEMGDEQILDDLIHTGSFKPKDIILLRDPSLLEDEGFMMKLSGIYYRTGAMWTFLCEDLSHDDAKRYTELVWKWAHSGSAGVDARWKNKISNANPIVQAAKLPEDVLDSLEALLGQTITEAYQFNAYPFRYANDWGVPETLPGRLGPDYGPAVLVAINPRPLWPHRLAYHGFNNVTNYDAIRRDSWKLKGCQRRCYYGKGVYSSPSFIVAMRHYGCTLQLSNGHFYRVCLQVALRNEQIHPASYGHRQHDPQWQDYATDASSIYGDAPELLVPNLEDVQVIGLVFSEIIFSSILAKKPSFYTGYLT